jgi:hypothetical protein
MADTPERLPGDEMGWYWQWEALTRKDPAFSDQWRGYFTNATGVNPVDVGLETAYDALKWQQARSNTLEKRLTAAGTPESANVQVGEETGPRVSPTQWWQQTVRYRRDGRIEMGEFGLEATDPYDTEVVKHIRAGIRPSARR